MATNKPLTPEEAVDMSRRAVGRRVLMRTLRDIFSYRNPLRQFMDAYRFNVIRWSASNLREPTLGKRVGCSSAPETRYGFSATTSGRTART